MVGAGRPRVARQARRWGIEVAWSSSKVAGRGTSAGVVEVEVVPWRGEGVVGVRERDLQEERLGASSRLPEERGRPVRPPQWVG